VGAVGSLEMSRLIIVDLENSGPKSSREIVIQTDLNRSQVYNALHRLWRGRTILRTRVSIKVSETR